MKLIVNELAVNYQDAGKGQVLLFLHGWQSDGNAFNGLAKKLQKKYRVLRPDLPGFGGSEPPNAAWDLDAYINFINAFLEKLKIRRVHALVAHSLGGRIAIKGVGEGLLRADKLILIGAHGIRESNSLRNRMLWLAAKTGKLVSRPLPSRYRKALRQRLYKTAGSSDYLQAGALQQVFTRIIKEDVRPEAAMISIPTLLIYGQSDNTTPPRYGKVFASLIADSTLEIIPGAGHFTHQDQPAVVDPLIEQFLK